MDFCIGPVLNLRKASADQWAISILVGVAAGSISAPEISEPTVMVAAPVLLATYSDKEIYRFNLVVPLNDDAREIEYKFGETARRFTVPAKEQRPEMVFMSCNGYSSDRVGKNVDDKLALWNRLVSRHVEKPYNLMIMGGDQVYADEIWHKCTTIKAWMKKRVKPRRKAKFTKAMEIQVERFYFKLYCDEWTIEPLRSALASIPTSMMWDDHDIIDGWGSDAVEDQDCEVYQGIFRIAEKYFRLFQQQLGADADESHNSAVGGSGYSLLHECHKIAILTLDTRSERSLTQIITKESWRLIFDKLDAFEAQKFEHIFVVAPVPVVHADFGGVESSAGWLLEKVDLDDDLRDHWQNSDHRIERLRLIHRLFDVMENSNSKITILSGDVHLACLGQVDKVKSDGTTLTIDQLTASGIVHPAPNGVMSWVLNSISKNVEQVDHGITAKMNEFAALRKKFILERNYLSVEPDKKGRIWANWNVEGRKDVITKVIHAMDKKDSADNA